MSIIINIDVMLAKRKMSVTELSERVGITMANISILKNGKAKAIKLSTLNSICKALNCQPGDILEYVEDEDDECISRDCDYLYYTHNYSKEDQTSPQESIGMSASFHSDA